jgi:peptidyl-prolyl cis-trans isomerase A (cyclophilin A)
LLLLQQLRHPFCYGLGFTLDWAAAILMASCFWVRACAKRAWCCDKPIPKTLGAFCACFIFKEICVFMTLRLARRPLLATFLAAFLIGPSLAALSAKAQKVKINTSMGAVVIELNAAKSPQTVANFLQYVKDGHYSNTVFHRVMKDFMVQGGGMTADMKEKPTRAPIALESHNGLRNERGTVAMARTMEPDSATAQFFINVTNNEFLNAANSPDGNGYAVFGKVVSGMEVVDKIRAAPTGNKGPHRDVPLQAVIIQEITLEK